MPLELTNDEMILALMALIRAVNPAMLRSGTEGFSVDFAALDAKTDLSSDERLLMKLRAALESDSGSGALTLDLDADESRRLAQTLERLETLQAWPADVLNMSRALRARLTPA